MTATYILLGLLLSGLIGLAIGYARRQNPVKSFFVGGLLGILGWILLLVAKPDPALARECPACRSYIHRDATVCKGCGRDLPPLSGAAPRRSVGELIIFASVGSVLVVAAAVAVALKIQNG